MSFFMGLPAEPSSSKYQEHIQERYDKFCGICEVRTKSANRVYHQIEKPSWPVLKICATHRKCLDDLQADNCPRCRTPLSNDTIVDILAKHRAQLMLEPSPSAEKAAIFGVTIYDSADDDFEG